MPTFISAKEGGDYLNLDGVRAIGVYPLHSVTVDGSPVWRIAADAGPDYPAVYLGHHLTESDARGAVASLLAFAGLASYVRCLTNPRAEDAVAGRTDNTPPPVDR